MSRRSGTRAGPATWTVAAVLAVLCAAALALLLTRSPRAQDAARIEWQTFASPAIEGNLEGNPAERGAYVVTPPGYDENPDRRYPVVYFLHGYWGTPQNYQQEMGFDEAVDEAAAAGNELILVVPDGNSRLKGAYYSSSPTVGDYERFVAEDVVGWVDDNYRTIATRAGRGLAGHSMGGYGTIRIGMKHADTFSGIYMMSACCLPPQPLDVETARNIEAMEEADIETTEFRPLSYVSTLAAWSPDPAAEGWLKADTGLREDGTLDPLANYRIAANSPLVLLPQYARALNSLTAFAIDIGDTDHLLEGNHAFRAELERFGIAHSFELYEGDHTNRVGERIRSHVLPFFGEHLDNAN